MSLPLHLTQTHTLRLVANFMLPPSYPENSPGPDTLIQKAFPSGIICLGGGLTPFAI